MKSVRWIWLYFSQCKSCGEIQQTFAGLDLEGPPPLEWRDRCADCNSTRLVQKRLWLPETKAQTDKKVCA